MDFFPDVDFGHLGRERHVLLVEEALERLNIPVIVLTVPQHPVDVDPANGVHGILAMPFSG